MAFRSCTPYGHICTICIDAGLTRILPALAATDDITLKDHMDGDGYVNEAEIFVSIVVRSIYPAKE